MHRVHILHTKTPRADALEAQASSWVKYASACVFGCVKSESAFRFEFDQSVGWLGKFASACEFGSFKSSVWMRQKGKCFPFWPLRVVGLDGQIRKCLRI